MENGANERDFSAEKKNTQTSKWLWKLFGFFFFNYKYDDLYIVIEIFFLPFALYKNETHMYMVILSMFHQQKIAKKNF